MCVVVAAGLAISAARLWQMYVLTKSTESCRNIARHNRPGKSSRAASRVTKLSKNGPEDVQQSLLEPRCKSVRLRGMLGGQLFGNVFRELISSLGRPRSSPISVAAPFLRASVLDIGAC